MGKHALPSEAPKPGKHAGYYDVLAEVNALLAALRQLIRGIK